MKILKPSHRENKRYLLLNGKDATKENIDNCILEFIGVLGYAEASPKLLKNKNDLILSVNHKSVDKIRTSFLLSEKDIKIKKVSGTIKKLE
jgi:RNase P/RNase MRP subunit POP5